MRSLLLKALLKSSRMMSFWELPQKRIPDLELKIDRKIIECVPNFNLLGVTINQHLNWNPHIDNINLKISKIVGILSKLKHFLPSNILKMIYQALIEPHILYGILVWGYPI